MSTVCVTCSPSLPDIAPTKPSVSTIKHSTVCGVIVDRYNTAAVYTSPTGCVCHRWPGVVVPTFHRVSLTAFTRTQHPARRTGCKILPACDLNWKQTDSNIRFVTIQIYIQCIYIYMWNIYVKNRNEMPPLWGIEPAPSRLPVERADHYTTAAR